MLFFWHWILTSMRSMQICSNIFGYGEGTITIEKHFINCINRKYILHEFRMYACSVMGLIVHIFYAFCQGKQTAHFLLQFFSFPWVIAQDSSSMKSQRQNLIGMSLTRVCFWGKRSVFFYSSLQMSIFFSNQSKSLFYE